MLRKIWRGSLLVSYWILAVAAIIYFLFWSGYRDQQLARETVESLDRRLAPPRHVDSNTMRLLGDVRPGKQSHFIHFEEDKPPATIRVCALGDSNTNGDEVGVRHDYPSYLQRMFDRNGFDRVQVLNFGNRWYGYSQQLVMWRRVASRFDCDFVLMMPMDFWWKRDTTFNHTDGRYPGYLHARLVLERDGLRLVEPLGRTGIERRDEYLRAIPRWRYLRYDRHPTSFVDSILPAGRHIANPFYYDRRPEHDESRVIGRRVIEAIAEDGPQVVVLFRNKQQALYPGLIPEQPPGTGVVFLSLPQAFPYRAPAGHPSSWGHELTAEAFFRSLTGVSQNDDSRVVRFAPIEQPDQQAMPLHSYAGVWLEFDGDRLGFFVPAASRGSEGTAEYPGIFRTWNTAALLALMPPGGEIGRACFLPLREMPAIGSELLLETGGPENQSITLGGLSRAHSALAVFAVSVPYRFTANCRAVRDVPGEDANAGDGARLILDGRTVAKIDSKGSGEREFRPLEGKLLRLREAGEYLASADSLRTPETVDIVLRGTDDATIRHPFLVLETGREKLSEIVRRPANRIGVEDGVAKIIVTEPDGS